jgi:hypothetical protein
MSVNFVEEGQGKEVVFAEGCEGGGGGRGGGRGLDGKGGVLCVKRLEC